MYLFFRGLSVHLVPVSTWPKYFYLNKFLANTKHWKNDRIIRVKKTSDKYFSILVFESI